MENDELKRKNNVIIVLSAVLAVVLSASVIFFLSGRTRQIRERIAEESDAAVSGEEDADEDEADGDEDDEKDEDDEDADDDGDDEKKNDVVISVKKSKADGDGHMIPVRSGAKLKEERTDGHKCSFKLVKNVTATCLSEGYSLYGCGCGKQYVTGYATSSGHRYSAATCQRLATCSVCGKTTGSLGAHKWSQWYSMGHVSHYRICAVCDKMDEHSHSHYIDDPTYCFASVCTVCGWSDCEFTSFADGYYGLCTHEFYDGVCEICGYRRR